MTFQRRDSLIHTPFGFRENRHLRYQDKKNLGSDLIDVMVRLPATHPVNKDNDIVPPSSTATFSTCISIFTDRFTGFTEKIATEAYFHYFDVYIRYSFELNIFERTQDYE